VEASAGKMERAIKEEEGGAVKNGLIVLLEQQ
jgi:hypothetical protein